MSCWEPRPTQYLAFNPASNNVYAAQGEICEYRIEIAKDNWCRIISIQDGLKTKQTGWDYLGLQSAIDEAQRQEGEIRMRNSLIMKTITAGIKAR
jgi:hypothetical protein